MQGKGFPVGGGILAALFAVCLQACSASLPLFPPAPGLGALQAPVPEKEIPDPDAGSRIFPPPAAVVVKPPETAGGNGRVYLPNGTLLDVTGSTTAGLQEAVQYATNYGWDLIVLGTPEDPEQSTFHLSSSLWFPALQGRTIRMEGVVLDFGPGVRDAAVSFDSTMIVDFRLIGEIRAPYSSAGILFLPRNLVPLDGLLFGYKSQVDSRFRVERITARDYGVYFNRRHGSMEFNNYYFGSNEAQVAVGPFDHPTDSIWESAPEVERVGAMKPLPFDPLHPDEAVVVYPPTDPIGGNARVVGPDGTDLDVSGSTTAGLQEAFDLMGSTDSNLIVFGRGLQQKFILSNVDFPRTGFYFLLEGLRMPPMQDKFVQILNVTIVAPINLLENPDPPAPPEEPRISGTIDEPLLTIVDAENVDFELTGQIYGRRTMPANLLFAPSSSGGIVNSRFRIGHLPGSFATNVRFTATAGPIQDNAFLFHEILSADEGIRVDTPAAGACFCRNYVRANHLHGPGVIGMRLGVGHDDDTLINNNRMDLILNPDREEPQVGLQVYGRFNTAFLHIGAPGFQNGVAFAAPAEENSVHYELVDAANPFALPTPLAGNAVIAGPRPPNP